MSQTIGKVIVLTLVFAPVLAGVIYLTTHVSESYESLKVAVALVYAGFLINICEG